LFTGCVKSQYTAGILMRPRRATSVRQKSALPRGVRTTSMIVAMMATGSAIPARVYPGS
jgi:hypothetical protein